MGTKVIMTCDGCVTEHTTEPVFRRFESLTGKSYDIGSFQYPTITEVVEPTGWVWSDPHTGLTYCPTCWKAIESGGLDKDKTEEAPRTP